jgi:hypothetical protein
MLKCSIVPHIRHLTLLILILPAALSAQFITHLSPRSDQGFETYRKGVEATLTGKARYASGLKPGQITIAPMVGQGSVDVPNGFVSDWIVAAIVPRATPQQAIAVLQNYPAYKNVYGPDVVDSRVLRHEGDVWHVYLRLLKKKVLTVLLDAEFDVEYHPLGDDRWSMVSRSSRIAELDGNRQLPPGEGHGFLWRLNAYWLIEPRPEGVYLECRTLSLSRDIPTGLGWAVKPFVSSVPKDSLYDTMQDTIRAMTSSAETPTDPPARSSTQK